MNTPVYSVQFPKFCYGVGHRLGQHYNGLRIERIMKMLLSVFFSIRCRTHDRNDDQRPKKIGLATVDIASHKNKKGRTRRSALFSNKLPVPDVYRTFFMTMTQDLADTIAAIQGFMVA